MRRLQWSLRTSYDNCRYAILVSSLRAANMDKILTNISGSVGQKCATFSFLGGPQAWLGSESAEVSMAAQTYTNLFCDDRARVEFVYQSATNAPDGPISSSPVTNSATGSASARPSSSSASDPDSSSDSSSGLSHHSSSRKIGVGVIAGASVGGIVLLALIGALVGLLLWRKRKTRMSSTPEVSTYH